MAKTISEVFADALERLINFLGESITFTLGLLGSIIIGALPAVAEVTDDIANFKNDPIYWGHVIKILAAGVIPAISAYFAAQNAIKKALATPPPTP